MSQNDGDDRFCTARRNNAISVHAQRKMAQNGCKWLVPGLTSVTLADSNIQLSASIKILGATLDSNLTMGPHTKALSKSCFYHIRSFGQIRPSMDHSTAVSVALALVSSRLDYANSILLGSPSKHVARLERVQRALEL